jgi:hypothetical protein
VNFNFPKLLGDIVEGFVFFVYRQLEAIYIVARFPIRGPRVMAYRNLKNHSNSVGPHLFFLVNLIIGFFFIDLLSPLIFGNLRMVAHSFWEQFAKLQDSGLDFLPLILRSLAILMSADVVLRLATMMIRRRRKREMYRNSLLFSFGLQPLAVIVVFFCIMQYDLMNTRHENVVAFVTLALLVLVALPPIILTTLLLGPMVSQMIDQPKIKFAIPIFAFIFLATLHVEAGTMVWQGFASPPTDLELSELHCQVDAQKHAVVTAMLENKTKARFILFSRDAISVFADSNAVDIQDLETSSGKEPPFLILNDRALIWIKARVTARGGSTIDKDQKCKIWITEGSFVKAEKMSSWQEAK